MNKLSVIVLSMLLALVMLVAVQAVPEASATNDPVQEETVPQTQASTDQTEPSEPDDGIIDIPVTEPEEPAIQQGLVVENGNTYFYNEDGTLFTEGYKQVTVDGEDYYYFFQED
ncbi:MAG: hypothetical protein IKW10_04800, partial [Oscillospiraceae bacterium]|nr:hypothetical protein [Oscillospiraceae bacterium]